MLRDSQQALAIRGASLALVLGLSVLLARILGPAEYGRYAFYIAFVTLLAVPIQMGLSTLLVREAARSAVTEDLPRLRSLLGWGSRAWIAISVALIALGLPLLFLTSTDELRLRVSVLFAVVILVPILGAIHAVDAVSRGLGRISRGLIPEQVVTHLALVALVVILVVVGTAPARADIVLALHVGAGLVALGCASMMVHSALPRGVWKTRPTRPDSAWLTSLVPLSAIAGAHVVNTRADILLLGYLGAADQVGLYRVAVQGSMLVGVALQAVNTAAAPRFTSLYVRGDRGALQALARRAARLSALPAIAVSLALVFKGRAILGLVFGPEYTEAYVPLVILSLGQLANATAGPVGQILNMTGHEREAVIGISAAAVLNICLNAALIPRYGPAGAAFASALALVAWNVLLSFLLHQRLGVFAMALPRFMWTRIGRR